MGDKMLNIASEFWKYPAGRSKIDGPYNGETFRINHLAPKLREVIQAGGKLTVSMDGLLSCGSSFLDSAFGGLVRDDKFTKKELENHLRIVVTMKELERYRTAALRHIERALPS
ncbi:MAG: STAS-like domain-containing protein [Rhodobacteraceae bacterium]|nr:STAS-like domain-containing protein [Paracoccaceae bacterium]